MRELDDLEKKLTDRAADATSVQDITDLATALKTIADARGGATSSVTERRAYTLELTKALSALLVPIVSLLALAGTILVQTQQIAATRQQTENTEWRELLTSIKGEPGAFAVNDITIAPRLMSFASSQKYGQQAKAVATRIMGHLWNVDGFQDLLSYVFPEVTVDNFGDVLSVSRALLSSKRRLDDQCKFMVSEYQENDPNDTLKFCAISLTEKQFLDLNIVNKSVRDEIAKNRPIQYSLLLESFYLTQKMIPYIRNLNDLSKSKSTNFSNVWFQNADFSRMDLSQWDITGSVFNSPNFNATNLNFPQLPMNVYFDKANWWDAEVIGPKLLEWWVSRDEVETKNIEKVRRLCTQSHVTCDKL